MNRLCEMTRQYGPLTGRILMTFGAAPLSLDNRKR